jgi:DNA-binding NtrC family response regulator
VLILTANGGVDTVVQSMQAGAQDFFVKPASPERIMVSIRNALQMGDLTAEVGRLKKVQTNAVAFDDLVGESAPMRLVKRMGERGAKSGAPILILGESGVGKELIARAVHGASERAGKPFVAVNCGALPENLVESILFGHEKGSFTGATDKHSGKFQEAHGGTLFLDEIGELPLDMQVKLLRALQEGEIDPVGLQALGQGGPCRIVSATNRDLAQQVKDGRFREDLYYRLNVFPIDRPSLRERWRTCLAGRALHPPLQCRGRASAWSPPRRRPVGAARLRLAGQRPPAGERGLPPMILADGPYLQPHDFPRSRACAVPPRRSAGLPAARGALPARTADRPRSPVRILDEKGHLRTLEEIERDLIQLAIEIYAGHMSEVARRLGIGRSTLYRKVREQGLDGLIKEAV